MVGKGRSAASDNSKGRQDGKKQQRDAEARMKSDRQSGRPVKGKDVEDAARGAEKQGYHEQKQREERGK